MYTFDLLFFSISLKLRRGATRCVRVSAGFTLLKLSTKRLDAFSNNEKKTSGLSSCFDFLKFVAPTRDTRSLSHFLHTLVPRFPTVSDPQQTGDDEGISDDLIRMMGTATITVCDGDDDEDDGDWGACHDGGRLAYLCCAWQYSALSS